MSSFSCPKYDFATDGCMRLGVKCSPCQPGCVLHGKAVVAEPALPKPGPGRKRKAAPRRTATPGA